jgi:hypothetical protein
VDRDGYREQHEAARDAKMTYWRSLDVATRIALGDELRRHALKLHPDWPTRAQRDADLAGHIRFIERLEHVAKTRKR